MRKLFDVFTFCASKYKLIVDFPINFPLEDFNLLVAEFIMERDPKIIHIKFVSDIDNLPEKWNNDLIFLKHMKEKRSCKLKIKCFQLKTSFF